MPRCNTGIKKRFIKSLAQALELKHTRDLGALVANTPTIASAAAVHEWMVAAAAPPLKNKK
jgi:hypothetical protein